MHKFLDCLELKTRRNLGTGLPVAVVAALLVIAPAAGAHEKHKKLTDKYPSDVASAWFDTLYEVVKSEATPPPPASRIYGVTAVALYESVVSGTEENRSIVGQLNGLNALPEAGKRRKYHWPTVANAVLAETIRGIFTSLKPENLEPSTPCRLTSMPSFKPTSGAGASNGRWTTGKKSPTPFWRGPPPTGLRS